MKRKPDTTDFLQFFVCWFFSGIMFSAIFLSPYASSKLPSIFYGNTFAIIILGITTSFIFSFVFFISPLSSYDLNEYVEEDKKNVGYENVKQMLKELEKTDEEFGVLLGKIELNINMLSTSEWEAFDNIFGVLLRFKQWYLKGCIDYHNNGNTPCAKNKQSYFCNGCAIYDLTPWRADWNLRCPTGNTTQFKK